MLIQKLRYVLRAVFIGSLLFAFCHGAYAQDQGAPAENQPAKKRKSSADTCDGALDIVPAKAMTFTRKRRPLRTGKPGSVDAKDAKDSKDVKDAKDSKDSKPDKQLESGGGTGG